MRSIILYILAILQRKARHLPCLLLLCLLHDRRCEHHTTVANRKGAAAVPIDPNQRWPGEEFFARLGADPVSLLRHADQLESNLLSPGPEMVKKTRADQVS
ncbi:hypothetical protein P170DRAFT_200487 [Aspergillus steynii IBT 23096]|uniref:Uncharacterized protein n=1 Tax=Aspergillus steynii IBT 23096 TaxID=1392250 RepID=A0A2I2G4X8_9EURO|nr:uncharacterized protein P170DRAFT_200487 [Aspergillus steynii IBT 23096]PLB47931.1 hypothetical protein P170DRAFT_200487 [Aspergillus steynii IBT 23096]